MNTTPKKNEKCGRCGTLGVDMKRTRNDDGTSVPTCDRCIEFMSICSDGMSLAAAAEAIAARKKCSMEAAATCVLAAIHFRENERNAGMEEPVH